jgi:hypothetical protein
MAKRTRALFRVGIGVVCSLVLVTACGEVDDGADPLLIETPGGGASGGGAAAAGNKGESAGAAGAAGASEAGGASTAGQSSGGAAGAAAGGASGEAGSAGGTDVPGGAGGSDAAAGAPAAGAGGAAGKAGAAGASGAAGKAGAGGKAPLPECDCFVKEAWCGAGVQKEAESRGCAVPLLPAHADDILSCPGGKWSVKESCAKGCIQAPAGTADSCKPEPCDLVAVKSSAYLLYGLHPDASDALRQIGLDAGDISQTIGNASASAGTHAQDGTAEGKPYSAATDIRVAGLTQTQIKKRLADLASVGFVAWYRWPGHDGWPSSEAPHIHAIWVGAKMKLSLRDQVRDWIAGKNGLASHTTYTFYTWEKCRKDAIWQRYLKYNPAKG